MFLPELPTSSRSTHSLTRIVSRSADSEVLRILCSLLPAELTVSGIEPSSRLCDLGIGSFNLIGLVIQLEDEFSLDEAALGQIHGALRIDELCAVCNRSLARASQASNSEAAQ